MAGLREFTCTHKSEYASMKEKPFHVVIDMESDASPVTFPRMTASDSHVFVLKGDIYECVSHSRAKGSTRRAIDFP